MPRDSEASRMAANIAKYNNFASGSSNRGTRHANLLARARTKTVRERVSDWSQKAAASAATGDSRPRPHQLIVSGRVIWCNTCGAYATGHAVRLARSCEGPVDIKAAGGRAQQLRKLRAGKHPKTGHLIGEAIPWHRVSSEQQTEFAPYDSCEAPNDSDPDHTHGASTKREAPPRGDEDALRASIFGQLLLRVRTREQAKRSRTDQPHDGGTGATRGNDGTLDAITPDPTDAATDNGNELHSHHDLLSSSTLLHGDDDDDAMSKKWPDIVGSTKVNDESGAGHPLSKEPPQHFQRSCWCDATTAWRRRICRRS